MTRETDAAIAARIFGWTDVRQGHFSGSPDLWFGRAPHPQPGDSPQHRERGISMVPYYSTQMWDAWLVIIRFRDLWTAATDGVSGLDNDFPRPFDDRLFFDRLHRAADRRWPWAMLYVTPGAICRAALAAIDPKEDDE